MTPPSDLSIRVTAVIVNFNTRELTRRAALSLHRHYPSLPLLLIDNGSGREDAQALDELRHDPESPTTVIFNARNVHHGPAMDQAIRHLRSPYALLFDSDCEVIKSGFIEAMEEHLDRRQENYAAGHRIYMNKRGFDVLQAGGAFEYIRPYCMMIKRQLYLDLPPFRRHGAPCLENMRSAVGRGYSLIDFPVGAYVHHAGRGTAGKFGYQLGFQGKINYLLNKAGL